MWKKSRELYLLYIVENYISVVENFAAMVDNFISIVENFISLDFSREFYFIYVYGLEFYSRLSK